MSNPRCQWPGCEREARGPKSKWCEKHHKARRAQTDAAYYAKDPEARRAKKREYRKDNQEKVKASQRRWAICNPDKVRECKRNWRRKNKDTCYERENAARRLRYHTDPEYRARELERFRKRWNDDAFRMKILRRMRIDAKIKPNAFIRKHQGRIQECPRLHLRALNLPCGQHEVCSGCERIGGRRVEFRETGFKFGRGA